MNALNPLRLDIDPIELGSPEVISLSLVKQHCAVDGSTFDSLIHLYLVASIEWAENQTHRSVIAREHRWVLKDFPRGSDQRIRLPRGKTQSVTSIVYVDTDGATQTLSGPSSSPAGTDYQEDLRGDDGGVVRPPADDTWPEIDDEAVAPVVITFDAGYLSAVAAHGHGSGAAHASELPHGILHAVLFGVSDAFELRGAADLGSAGQAFNARQALLSPYQLVRWY